MKYTYLMLDADGTLFDFNRAERESAARTLTAFSLPCDDRAVAAYQSINDNLWKELERGEITQPELRVERFRRLNRYLGTDADAVEMNAMYSSCLGECAYLLPDAEEFCRRLGAVCGLYLVTNGVAEVQRRRFAKSGLAPYFSELFISGEIGFQKPDRGFFDHVASHVPNFSVASVLIVGDSLTSDIAGGHAARWDTMWLRPAGICAEPPHPPTYTVSSLREAWELLLGEA